MWKPILFVAYCLFFSVIPSTWGYEVSEVLDGGAVEGKVYLEGPVPPARIFHLIASPNLDFCSRISDGRGNRILRDFSVAEDGVFQDVVVALVGVKKGKSFDYTPQLTAKDCRMSPFISVVRNRHPLQIANDDPIVHDFQAYTLDGKGRVFEIFKKRFLPEVSASKKISLRPGHHIFHAQCGVHAYMQSWGIALGNPYFAISKSDGSFRIDDIMPGTYDMIIWHPYLDIDVRRVVIKPRETTALNIFLDASNVEIPLHDLQASYRFEPILQPSQILQPSVELQQP